MTLGQPRGNGGVELVEMPSEKMVRSLDNNQSVFSRKRGNPLFHFFPRTKFVFGAVNKELRLAAIPQKRKIATVHRDAESGQFVHPRIPAAYPQTPPPSTT